MGKAGKVIVFIIVCLVIVIGLTAIKETSKANGGPGAFMWIGAVLIPIIYRSLFSKKDDDNNQGNGKDVTTLNKE